MSTGFNDILLKKFLIQQHWGVGCLNECINQLFFTVLHGFKVEAHPLTPFQIVKINLNHTPLGK